MTSPFYEGTNVQFAWNSSALGEFKSCARKYQYKYLLGYAPRGQGMHLRFGLLYHGALELYDRLILAGSLPDESLDRVIDYLLRNTWDDRADDGSGGMEWETGDTKKNRYSLVRSVVWYIDHYSPDPARTLILADGSPALELEFKIELPFDTPEGEPYLYTGHLDRMVSYGDETFVTDRKTTGQSLGPYFFEQFSPDNQMSGYIYAGRVAFNTPISGVIIDAASILVGGTNFSRGITQRTEGQLAEWLTDTQSYLRLAAQYAGQGFWPMNDKACYFCEFRSVCSKDPAVRDHWLRTNFERDTHNAERILG